MKRTYSTPTAKMINYEYDLQVTATSPGGYIGTYGSKWGPEYCQMNSETCTYYYYDVGGKCVTDQMPFSLRR